LLNGIYSSFINLWENSFLHKILVSVSRFIVRLFQGSKVCNAISREGHFSGYWSSSSAGTLFDGAFNLPVKILRFFYLKLETYLKDSIAFKVLLFVLDYLHIGLAVYLFLVAFVPQSKWNNVYNLAGAFIFLLFYYIKCAITGNINRLTQVFDIFLALFILAIIIAEVFSIVPRESLRFFLFYLACFILAGVIALSIESRKQLAQLIEITLLAVAASGIYGLYQGIVGVAVKLAEVDINANEGMPGRVFSTMENTNNFAVLLSLFLPFFLAVVLNAKSTSKKVIYFLLAVPCLISLGMTYSRGSWVGFVVTVGVIIFFANWKLIPFAVIIAVLAFPFLPLTISRRIMTIINLSDSTWTARLKIYQTVIPMIKDYWVTGIGLGTDAFAKLIRNYYIFANMKPAHSHSLFLQIWLETGILGIASFFGFIAGIVKRGIKIIFKKSDRFIINILIAGISSIIGVLVSGLVDNIWFYPRVMLLFWVVTGIVLSAFRLHVVSDNKTEAHEMKVAA
jgi:Lipid A core - O-antigen ligase and related enzymes